MVLKKPELALSVRLGTRIDATHPGRTRVTSCYIATYDATLHVNYRRKSLYLVRG